METQQERNAEPPPAAPVFVHGPRDKERPRADISIMTVSIAKSDFERGLSPFHLGPVPLPDGDTASCVENLYQGAKVYPQHLDAKGCVSPAYWDWARRVWHDPRPQRYPMGKGAKPAFLLWNGERLDYAQARAKCYFPAYRDAVRQTESWRRLKAEHAAGRSIALWDFDGYREDLMGMGLGDVLRNTARTMGHAFVLKAMLLHGEQVRPEDLPQRGPQRAEPRPPQGEFQFP